MGCLCFALNLHYLSYIYLGYEGKREIVYHFYLTPVWKVQFYMGTPTILFAKFGIKSTNTFAKQASDIILYVLQLPLYSIMSKRLDSCI